ncbi:hypothetical protein ASG29_02505 [Sphingomonas sp. Leaf412]|uniref:hypothetical protein n=1 Tax=Sphingomonas sp. Leaf412 TaxID=1736370 RepID=UPI0006F95979|nr:hypothetical protein [Sphingomonas sp. Leaf412]KQT35022.1 hypothetical protein ASG29_02505 [Sphingomonas sp. Leaf412]
MSTRIQIAQATQLVRLRDVRVRAAAVRLATARAATMEAERARIAADEAADRAAAAHRTARDGLAADPGEAERLLALVDRARFDRSMAIETLGEARGAEDDCRRDEDRRRRTMILAQARHDALAERLGTIRQGAARVDEERQALDAEDVRRFR